MVGEYTEEDGKKLIKLARESIAHEFSGKEPEKLSEKQFKQARGVFVTLTENRKLRGCIGLPYPVKSVYEAVKEAAKSAAFSDPRFSSLKENELDKIKIEISILTMPEECKPEDVKVGKDGIMCSYVGYSGLFLPQVAVEYKMNRIDFLEALCNKAGLPNDTWQNKNFKLYRFQCEIFRE
ncbi:AmmeMemoRadiSam system protein A [Candidatus Pacearchaeota archaeon]|nr:AmmeMemoRadiSam system protein A [Candidatus Pacearchaeota archaeon]